MGESAKDKGGWRTNKWVRAAIPALQFIAGQFSARRLLIISALQRERQNGHSVLPFFSLVCLQRFLAMSWKRIFINPL